MKPRLTSYIDIEKMPDNPVIPDRLGALFWHFVRQAKGPFIWLLALNAACSAFNALMVYYVGVIIDALSSGGTPSDILHDHLWQLAGFVIFGLLLAPLTGIGAQYVHSIVVVPFFGNLIRRQSHWYVLRHSLSYFQNDFAGRIANKVQQMGPAMRDVMTQFIGSVMYVSVFIVTTTIMLMSADWFWSCRCWHGWRCMWRSCGSLFRAYRNARCAFRNRKAIWSGVSSTATPIS
jgi:ATP-binding cassette subfamily B multidrug efflux pump